MKNDLEEKINPKIAALAEYLGLNEEETSELIEDSNTYYSYGLDDYLVLESDEVDAYLDNMSDDEVRYIQSALEHSNFEYPEFVIVNQSAVRDTFDLNSIGIDWGEMNNYYIFTL